MDLQERIREAFRASGLSIRRVSKLAGLPYSATYCLLLGQTDGRMSTATKVCNVLGLELTASKRRKGR